MPRGERVPVVSAPAGSVCRGGFSSVTTRGTGTTARASSIVVCSCRAVVVGVPVAPFAVEPPRRHAMDAERARLRRRGKER